MRYYAHGLHEITCSVGAAVCFAAPLRLPPVCMLCPCCFLYVSIAFPDSRCMTHAQAQHTRATRTHEGERICTSVRAAKPSACWRRMVNGNTPVTYQSHSSHNPITIPITNPVTNPRNEVHSRIVREKKKNSILQLIQFLPARNVCGKPIYSGL